MNEYLFMVLLILQIADAASTVHVLKKGGVERNPVVAWMMKEVGVLAALVLIKLLMLIVLMALLPYLPAWFMMVSVSFYIGIIVNNLLVIRIKNR